MLWVFTRSSYITEGTKEHGYVLRRMSWRSLRSHFEYYEQHVYKKRKWQKVRQVLQYGEFNFKYNFV